MKKTVVRITRQLHDTLMFLSIKCCVYKTDLSLYANTLFSNKSGASRLLNSAERNGFIIFKDFTINQKLKNTYKITDSLKEKYHIAKSKKEPTPADLEVIKKYKRLVKINKQAKVNKPRKVKVALLTNKGYAQLRQELSNIDTLKQLRDRYENYLTSNLKYDWLLANLNQNHIKTLFSAVNIPTDINSRPTLEMLYCYTKNLPYKGNLPMPDKKSMQEYLTKGMYFSSFEFKDFVHDFISSSKHVFSPYKGIYIQADKCLIVYSNGTNNDSLVYIKMSKNEKELIRTLIQCNFINDRTVNTEKVCVSALTISDTNMFMYATASGNRSGLIKKALTDNIKETLLIPENNALFKATDKYDVCFNRLYAVQHSKAGIEHLRYIVSNTLEDSLMNAYVWSYEEPDKYKEVNTQIMFPLKMKDKNNKYIKVLYLPVYELTSLVQVRDSDTPTLIITDPSMIEVIEHIVHKEQQFIDINSKQILAKDSSLIYDSKGYIAGKKILEDYLHKKGKTLTVKEFNKVEQYFSDEKGKDYTHNGFYNAIANGEIDLDSIYEALDTIDYMPIGNKVHKVQYIVHEQYYNELKAYCAKTSLSPQKVTQLALYQYLDDIKKETNGQ